MLLVECTTRMETDCSNLDGNSTSFFIPVAGNQERIQRGGGLEGVLANILYPILLLFYPCGRQSSPSPDWKRKKAEKYFACYLGSYGTDGPPRAGRVRDIYLDFLHGNPEHLDLLDHGLVQTDALEEQQPCSQTINNCTLVQVGLQLVLFLTIGYWCIKVLLWCLLFSSISLSFYYLFRHAAFLFFYYLISFFLLYSKLWSDEKVEECSSCSLEELVCINMTEKVCRSDTSCGQDTAVSSCSIEQFTEHRLQCTTEMQAGLQIRISIFLKLGSGFT